jgi:hypothetical protein
VYPKADKFRNGLHLPAKPVVRFEQGETTELSAMIMTPRGLSKIS